MNSFLPTSAHEMRRMGWDRPDVIIFTGDAYVDHPSFGAAVMARVLESNGLRVAVVPQPNWRDDLRDFRKLGEPRLFFGVTSGNMDSMVNHYTAARRLRSDDAYTPGGRAGARPDRAATVYAQILKRLYPHTPVILGGIEASMRRLTHYDYWDDCLRPSILVESGADLLCYGMAERAIAEVARALANGFNAKLLRQIPQSAFLAGHGYMANMHSYEKCLADKRAFAENFTQTERESNRLEPGKTLVEPVGARQTVVNPPYPTPTTEELDRAFDLPYTRLPHPRYRGKGEIPAYEMIKFSVNIHRGCFGGCSFCTISAHQGKFIASRSPRSIVAEVEQLSAMRTFKGILSDAGGPSANMFGMGGRRRELCLACARPSCLHPALCPNLDNSHAPLLELYDRIAAVHGVRKLFIGSGIRYDLFDDDHGARYLEQVVANHTSGRLKVAPEHTEAHVLAAMRKPPFDKFLRLKADFDDICRRRSLRYQLVPYFISSHPGCAARDMSRLAEQLHSARLRPEQVQDFTPTPMTLSSVMYYTGFDPYSGRPLYVERAPERKRAQKEFFFR
ncbi:MAG: YgiQ family radical SAM protein [Rikenellaceae bacterium]|jgi:uncharacterized radical SAM protein YgiQ|nr:YgiQ family radical SAM protein [Rikenellaceae bacterium]